MIVVSWELMRYKETISLYYRTEIIMKFDGTCQVFTQLTYGETFFFLKCIYILYTFTCTYSDHNPSNLASEALVINKQSIIIHKLLLSPGEIPIIVLG